MSLSVHFVWENPDAFNKLRISVSPFRNSMGEAFIIFHFCQFHVRTVFQKMGNSLFVFCRRECAGRVKHQPPGRSISAAWRISSFWISESSMDFSGVQSLARASSLRNIPSPEHGASRMILSKNSGNALVNFAGVSFATKTFGMPKSSRLRRRALAREVLISFATRSPCP